MQSVMLMACLNAGILAQTPRSEKPPATSAIPLTGTLTVAPPKPGSVDEAIALALRQHPDVKLAEARRMVADAELEQAKLLVTQRITSAFVRMEQAKIRVSLAEKLYELLLKAGTGTSHSELTKKEQELQAAKAELAVAEADLLAAKGGVKDNKSVALVRTELAELSFLEAAKTTLKLTEPVRGDGDLRTLLEKKVSLDLKRQTLPEAFHALLDAAGKTNLTVRLPEAAKKEYVKNPPLVGPHTGEMTVAAWIQMIMDDFTQNQDGLLEEQKGRYEVYVREYGLLVRKTDLAPGGNAPTLSDYLRMTTEKPAAVKEPKKP